MIVSKRLWHANQTDGYRWRVGLSIFLAVALIGCGQDVASDDADGGGVSQDGASDDDSGEADAGTFNNACTADDDCAAQFPEKGPCQDAMCDKATGVCSLADKADGTVIEAGKCFRDDAGNHWQGPKTCSKGQVGDAVTARCDAGPCTESVCDAAKAACELVPLTDTACDDGDACTTKDACKGGSCAPGTKVDCVADGPCVVAACDAKTGKCVQTPVADGAGCDDGNACTVVDTCKGGKCASGAAKECGDLGACVSTACDVASGLCTKAAVTDGKACDDGDSCTEKDSCKAGKCGGTAMNCPTPGACLVAACEPASGKCNTKPGPDSVGCDDGDKCTASDACKAGKCAGVAAVCDDKNVCTDDSCDAKTGCQYKPNTKPCDDGDSCTDKDVCKSGKCAAGVGICQCQGDADCAAKTGGKCAATYKCDKAKVPFTCQVTKAAVTCEKPGDPCLVSSCDPNSGGCVNKAGNEGVPCTDNNKCTGKDSCKAGKCIGDAGAGPKCSDDNSCTDDTCDPKAGCTFPPNNKACDDNNKCTGKDVCASGKCKGSAAAAPSCDDKNPCTNDSCDAKAGCQYGNNSSPCDADGDKCTASDKCAAGQCKAGAKVNCGDGGACVQKVCDKQFGCKDVNLTKACSDGNACTTGDQCAGGKCAPKANVTCNDNKDCTADSCDPKTGCQYSANKADGKSCDDGDKCTTSDSCSSGVCKGGGAKSCDDGKKCTQDACDAKAGCSHTPISGCNDCGTKLKCVGAALPTWKLYDENPTSPWKQQTYGPDKFKGTVTVLFFLHGY